MRSLIARRSFISVPSALAAFTFSDPLAIAVIVAAIGALELLEAQVGGIFVQGWPWGTFLVLGGLWELRPALTRPSVSRQAA